MRGWRGRCGDEEIGSEKACSGVIIPTQGMIYFLMLLIRQILKYGPQRFAHSSATTSVKIESHVRFPSTLDMRPYVDSSTSSKSGKDKKGKELPDSLYIYDLFAVVTHEGKLDNGHYWADVRDGEEWWHCDDDKGESKMIPKSLIPVAHVSANGSDSYITLCCIGAEGVHAVLRQTIHSLCPADVEVVGQRQHGT